MPTNEDILSEALRDADPEPYDGADPSKYYREFARNLAKARDWRNIKSDD